MRAIPVTFTRARVRGSKLIYVACSPDDDDPFTPFTRICGYDDGIVIPDRDKASSNKWGGDDLDVCVTSIALYLSELETFPLFCFMSAEGDVILNDAPRYRREKVLGAGISSAESLYGRMSHLRQIGKHLYACGDGGQIYKRDDAAFGEGVWTQLAPKLLQRLSDRLTAMQTAPNSPEARAKIYFCVNGPSEQEIYVCGAHGVILCWDGFAMHEVPSGTTASLINILVLNEKTIYICGRDGTLLRGNRRDGFLAVPGFGGGQGFTSMTLCGGKLYLGSNSSPRGLFVYDGGLPQRVSCGMVPDIEDVNVIDSADDVLWVVGSKDLLRFDGESWERIDYPDNDPVGQPPRGGGAAAPTARATLQPPDPIARFAAMQDFPNAMARRINCYGMGAWLEQLLGWLGRGLPDAAAPLQEKIEIGSAQRDIRITLYRIQQSGPRPSWDDWVLSQAQFGPGADLPLGLKASIDTPATVSAKLGPEGARGGAVAPGKGGLRISYFLPGGIVVGNTYGPDDEGITNVILLRLGAALDWNEIARSGQPG
jgi:hypothetical protein